MDAARAKIMAQDDLPYGVRHAIAKSMKGSAPLPEESPKVKGYDFNLGVNYPKLMENMPTIGFQAAHLGRAIQTINTIIDTRFKPVPEVTSTSFHSELISEGRKTTNCTIMLGYTSNMVSSGNREVIRYLVQHNMVDSMVTTAGGIEEDFMKCMGSFYMGDFSLRGEELYKKNINRTGNLLVPNVLYRRLREWMLPILDAMVEEQKTKGTNWTPSKLIWRLGKEINNPESIYYWAYKNRIPVFSPAITDGAVGDNLYFHRHLNPGNCLKLDIVEDVQRMNDIALFSVNTGVILMGAGLIKHHILNANCLREGSDFSVYVNTAAEFDGSDAGASPDEAVSWGKIKSSSKPVKVFADATLAMPLIVAETFAKREAEFTKFNSNLLA